MNTPYSTSRLRAFWSLLLLLLCAACGTALTPGAATPPDGPVHVSSAAADELEKNIRNQLLLPGSRNFALTVTSEQVTSFTALHNTSLPLEKPQIWFSGTHAYLRGTFTALCLWHPDVLVVAAPRINNGRLDVNIVQISVGGNTLPPDWLPTISQSIRDSIEEANRTMQFERIEIREGSAVLSGRKQ